MKRALRILALLIAIGAIAFWAAKGANRGWSKNQVAKTTVDEVTGIEAITYEKEFVPGIDFIGGALLGAGILGAASFAFRAKQKT